MSKKIIATLFLLLVLLTGFAFINFVYLKDSKPAEITDLKAPKKSSPAASLALTPNSLTASATQSAALNVTIESAPDSGKKLIQIELAYDPASLYGLYITPGEYLINPQIVLNNIDVLTGRISYALSGDTNVSDTRSDILATINFTAPNYGVLRQTEIKFLPKTLMRIDDEAVRIASMSDGQIIISPSQYIPTASQGASLNPKL